MSEGASNGLPLFFFEQRLFGDTPSFFVPSRPVGPVTNQRASPANRATAIPWSVAIHLALG